MPHVPRARVISLSPNITSILHELGALRDVVAVSRWCKDVAPVEHLPAVGDCWKLSMREVMRHTPTLLVGSVPFALETVEEILAEPVAFLAINPRTLADIDANIRTLAALVGRAVQSEKLVARMHESFAALARNSVRAARLAAPRRKTGRVRRKPVVYAEAWSNPRISSPPWVSELIALAGATPAFPGGAKVSDAEVAAANPDVIVLAWTATGTRAPLKSALENPAWQNVSAVNSGRVHVIADELLNTPGPPLIEGAEELFRAIWGHNSAHA
jgi:ABC-type Fe3+-hydroxamate transport system substrate-binding protein